jgi:hypothetical protein
MEGLCDGGMGIRIIMRCPDSILLVTLPSGKRDATSIYLSAAVAKPYL